MTETELLARLDERFKGLSDRFEKVERKIDHMEDRTAKIRVQVAGWSAAFGALYAAVTFLLLDLLRK